MSVWFRTSQNAAASFVFSGDGGLFTSGRWNYTGTKVVYCSESIALATLEWLSHHGLSVSAFSYYKFSIQIPDNLIIKFSPSQLPNDWDLTPSTDICRDFAIQKLYQKNGPLAIAVPSVVVSSEYNLVINPMHSKYLQVQKSIKFLGQFTAPSR